MTLFCARLDFNQAQLEVGNAGHPPQWLYRADRDEFVELPASSLPLGAFAEEVFGMPNLYRTSFGEGDYLFLFTDGWVEIDGPEGNPLGLERFQKMLRRALERSSADPIPYIVEAARTYAGGRFRDDALLVTVRIGAGAEAEKTESRKKEAPVHQP